MPGWLGRGSIPLAGLVVPFVKRMVKPHPSIHMNNNSENFDQIKPTEQIREQQDEIPKGPHLYTEGGSIHFGISLDTLKEHQERLKEGKGWWE